MRDDEEGRKVILQATILHKTTKLPSCIEGLISNQHNRVLTVHGSSDTVIPVEDAHEFANIIPNHRLHIIEGADHSYTNHQDELTSVVVNFIKETLHLDSNTANEVNGHC